MGVPQELQEAVHAPEIKDLLLTWSNWLAPLVIYERKQAVYGFPVVQSFPWALVISPGH